MLSCVGTNRLRSHLPVGFSHDTDPIYKLYSLQYPAVALFENPKKLSILVTCDKISNTRSKYWIYVWDWHGSGENKKKKTETVWPDF